MTERRSAFDQILGDVVAAVERGDIDPTADDRDTVASAVSKIVGDYQRQAQTADEQDQMPPLVSVDHTVERVLTAVVDYGQLTELLDQHGVEEVLIQGDELWYIVNGELRQMMTSPSESKLFRAYVDRLLTTSPQKVPLDQTNPILSVGIPGAMRLSVKVSPVADELTVTIRRRTDTSARLGDLVDNHTLSPEAAGFLWLLMQSRGRIVTAGAPGAGKTHLVNALLGEIPLGADHIVRINEETPELNAQLPLGGYTRTTNFRDTGIDLRDLIQADLRFRAGWLVVGETRGAEAWELLRTLNAGTGFMTTTHAESAAETVDSLMVQAMMAGQPMPVEVLRSLLAKGIDVVVFCEHDQHLRRVTEIVWVENQLSGGEVVVNPLFEADDLDAPLRYTGAAIPQRAERRLDRAAVNAGLRSLKSVLAGDTTVRLT